MITYTPDQALKITHVETAYAGSSANEVIEKHAKEGRRPVHFLTDGHSMMIFFA